MTRALSPEDIYLLQCVTDVQLSPNGLQVAYVVKTADRERDRYRSRIAVVDVDSGRSEQRSEGEHEDVAPRWSPDGESLAFLSNARPHSRATRVAKLVITLQEARSGQLTLFDRCKRLRLGSHGNC